MAEKAPPSPRQARRTLSARVGRVGTQLMYLLIGLVATSVVGIALVSVLVLIQARRDETRPVDAAIILPEVNRSSTVVDRAADLYRRGYTQRLMVSGADSEQLRAALLERGLPDGAILSNAEGAEAWADLASLARQNGVTTVLVVTEKADMLRALKTARDLGLISYAAPLPGLDPDFPTVVRASLAYWGYVFSGQ